jgi:hypothetical protein
MYSLMDTWGFLRQVSPFGHLRVNGYVRLTAAFRSLSRPSSAPSAKAFALCSLLLDLCVSQHVFLSFYTQNVVAILRFYFFMASHMKYEKTTFFSILWLLLFCIQFSRCTQFAFATVKWRLRDSNSRPPACKAGALPTELNPQRL